MVNRKLGTLVLSSLVVIALSVGCSDDAPDEESGGGTSSGGKAGSSSAGNSTKAGSAGKGSGGNAGSGGSGAAGKSSAGEAGRDAGGSGGSDVVSGGAGGETTDAGGQGGADDVTDGGAGGSGGEAAASCETVRTQLLGPIDSVSTGLVTLTSDPSAATVTVVVDASAGGYAAAALNPYIYLSLANKAAVAVSDPAADSSLAWDLAFKRDNIRSNSGDSGAGSAQIATLSGADFAAVTATDAATADFGSDAFVDPLRCEPIFDAVGKPLTRFDGWYDYDQVTNGLTPADNVYLIKGANGTSLYKLEITGYYVDVSDGGSGTVKKSAVYSLTYQAL